MIAAVERVEIPEQDGSVRLKAALVLQGWPAKLLLNKTNFETLAAAYGRQSAGWLGKPLEVFPATALLVAGRCRRSGCGSLHRWHLRLRFQVRCCLPHRRYRLHP